VLLGVLSLLILASVPLFGGRLGRLAELRLRWPLLLPAGLGLQILLIEILQDADIPHGVLHMASYAVIGAFVVANLHIPGMALIGLGGGLNAAAIAANGGVMPASPRALDAAGFGAEDGFVNSGAVEDARLAFLGDVFAVPESWPLTNVFSVGDVILLIGLAYGVHVICGSRLGPPARRLASRLRLSRRRAVGA
jgi:hypothetical protein